MMMISEKGLRLIEDIEGNESHMYLDSGGAPTIGIGHLLTKDERLSGKITIKYGNPHTNEVVKYSEGLSLKHIYALLRIDLVPVESMLKVAVKVALDQNQYDALCSFVFNIGIIAFVNSTLLKRLNAGAYGDVPAQMERWVMDNGKRVQGLVNRRVKEISMW